MTTKQHTRGRWRATKQADGSWWVDAYPANGVGQPISIAGALSEPDARLIAAAPGMLEAMHLKTTSRTEAQRPKQTPFVPN